MADENIQARLRGMAVMYYSNATKSLALTTGNKTEMAFGYCTLYGDMNGGLNCLGGLYKHEVFAIAKYINSLAADANKEIIPLEIINKAPSAELKPGQTDEASLLPYPILDKIAEGFIEKHISTFKSFCAWIADSKPYTDFSKAKGLDDLYKMANEYALLACWMEPTIEPRVAFLKAYLDKRGEKHENSTLLAAPETQYNRLIKLIKVMEFKRRQAAPCIKVHQIDFGTGRRLPIVQGFN